MPHEHPQLPGGVHQHHLSATPQQNTWGPRIGTLSSRGQVSLRDCCLHRWGQPTHATYPCKALPTGRLQDTLKQARKTGLLNWGTQDRLQRPTSSGLATAYGCAKPKQGQGTPQPVPRHSNNTPLCQALYRYYYYYYSN